MPDFGSAYIVPVRQNFRYMQRCATAGQSLQVTRERSMPLKAKRHPPASAQIAFVFQLQNDHLYGFIDAVAVSVNCQFGQLGNFIGV